MTTTLRPSILSPIRRLIDQFNRPESVQPDEQKAAPHLIVSYKADYKAPYNFIKRSIQGEEILFLSDFEGFSGDGFWKRLKFIMECRLEYKLHDTYHELDSFLILEVKRVIHD